MVYNHSIVACVVEGFVVAVIIGVVLGVLIGAIPLGFVYLCLKRFVHPQPHILPLQIKVKVAHTRLPREGGSGVLYKASCCRSVGVAL